MIEITDETFNKNLVYFHKNNNIPFLIMFYSDSCSYCNVIESYLNKTRNVLSKKEFLFYKIHIKNEKIIKKYLIRATPTILLFDEKRKLEEKLIGTSRLEELKEKILKYKKETTIEKIIKLIKKETK